MFLLVLDDIWDVSYDVWNNLNGIFNVGETESRIVITTRNESDAITMRNFLPIHRLEPLETEDCLSLLAKHAFGASNNQKGFNLEEIGREIAQKCDGLPLAAVALGGLLRNNLSPDDWNDVLRSNIWELEKTRVKPALLLSYHYLPGHLKRCFAYCAIFPKNYKLEKEVIIPLWISEGLVLQPKTEKSWESVGEKYFDELVSRSLIQQQSVDGKEIFEMHDLMNDLATTVSYPYCVRLDQQKVVENLERFPNDCISNEEVDDLFREMKHLHSLSLSKCSLMTKVPTSIGNLIYLRYLNLSDTLIKRLPSETWKLVHLQTLIVSNCRSLVEFPEDVGKLVSLHNLNVRGTSLKEMPVQITKLKNLQTLSDFIVSKQCGGLKVGELEKFPHLRGNLFISELQNVTNPSDASKANLEQKKQFEELKLKWDHPSPSDSDSHIQSGVLERLRPSVNLKSLTIKGYGGTNFSNWLGDSSYNNIVYFEMENCDNCSQLPPLGQLGKLKELIIRGMKSVKSVGAEFYGKGSGFSFQQFPSLETVPFYDMSEWEEWNLIGGTTTEFPSLRSLILSRCRKLKGNIPTNLHSLTNLQLWECPLLVEPWSSNDNSNTDSSINDCENMKFIAHESLLNYTSLESLDITESCYSMTSFTLGTFPVLKTLWICGCQKLKTILIIEDASQQQSLSFLERITIWFCNELESFSFGGIGLVLSIPNLSYLNVNMCKKLRSLPEPMNTLVGLREMTIYNLPNLQSIAKDGFPINLQDLEIGYIQEALWNTIVCEHLTCLSKLVIYNGDMVKALMKMKVGLLPSSLVTLYISNLGDIEHLDGKWLQHLTSLQELKIDEAPNLKSLPEEVFPSSLSKLRIDKCPLLEERLQNKQGKEWSKIAHIPVIKVNRKTIKE